MRKPQFEGGQRKVAREVLEAFGVCGATKEAVAERARASGQFAAMLRRLAERPAPYVETQTLLSLATGWWWQNGERQADKTLTDDEFIAKAEWLLAEHAKQPPPVPQGEYRRRVDELFKPHTPAWPS